MTREAFWHRIFLGLRRYLTFFALVAFVTSCCVALFLSLLTQSMGLTLTEGNISIAAKITFANVLLLSLLFALVDSLRRKYTVEKPVQRIVAGAERIMAGDFSVRIQSQALIPSEDPFHAIIDCFNRMARELQGVETLRTDFIANVSHEMKTPLAVMRNYGTLLQAPDLSEEKRLEYAKGITESSRRLADMMTNILKLNRLENQQIFPKTEEYDLSEQLCESLLQFETLWERETIDIDTDIPENVTISADRELLSLVWNNLLSNAFKFTPAGGTVGLTLAADDTYATVTVRDTGCGMGPEVGAHIFEKFYQGDTSHSVQGNGLGLALVKRVVDILQGEIRVESTLGQGSAFTVRIRRGL